MQFRGEIEAWILNGDATKDGFYLPGTCYTRCSLDQATLYAALGCSRKSVVVCSSWKALCTARKAVEYGYLKHGIFHEKVIDDCHVKVQPIIGEGEGIIEFVIR